MHRTAPPLLCGTRLPRALAVVFVAALAAGCDPSEHTTGQGAVVTLLPRAPEEIDPRHVFDAYGLRVSRLLFASLVTIDPETLAAVPDLAEAITVESPTVYVARLRPGLTFADGTALDAADVVATFESVRDPKIGSRYARTYERIVRMEVRDRFTVAFHLDAPHAPFMTDLELP
ncbi:MAG: ABC transporter substrate-binding protein, partial [Myxococcales bacterium]|nr:ABC transporter substrate-binding protein [Myxococcales bacterium]